jgi:hypothetical protein
MITVRDGTKRPTTAEEFNWENSVISNNPDKLVIYVTHNYLSGKNDVGGQSTRTGVGTTHWDNVIKNHSNIVMVHCGHLGTLKLNAYRRVDYISGNPVHQIIQNFQGDKDSNWLRYYIIKPAQNEIMIKTYSPVDAQYKTESNQQFTLSYPFHGTRGALDQPE